MLRQQNYTVRTKRVMWGLKYQAEYSLLDKLSRVYLLNRFYLRVETGFYFC